MLLKEIKNIFHQELGTVYPKEEIDSFFYMMIEHYLGLERFVLALEPNLMVSKAEEGSLFSGLSQLKLQRPIQHILGKAHFFDLEFSVTQDVLIPRPETEELVQWILDTMRIRKEDAREPKEPIRILDIGTGSGCIAISLAKNLGEAKVFALDVSQDALKIAKQNALDNEVEIEFLHSDILQLKTLDDTFDVIVSNPPYVRELEKKEMNANVLDHEPNLALFVSDHDPLVFYRTITAFATTHLKNEGVLFFEINQYLGEASQELLEAASFTDIELRKDMFGNDRMLKGVLKQ
ncbi:peptide chain release factor N(5)-glutamine methyltransferase [Arenibacter sp. 6A1]|uniref:peptide chain release factor N(5)-glutamine methyltransferase n=1 Tax=Arenibacter sp. 6A1 TaxID=2720391 RepID=UPI0014468B81|nr:peptide chain release factor N(5)-glutamine methyltransferase [Arenibacter sp. 6A1]NKI25958.1 peptide chain release factor N(5)-glutamine methyltransferase [Arenibacter sp. 6A1]